MTDFVAPQAVAKPPPQIAGVAGFNAFTALPGAPEPAIDWARVQGLPAFQMFLAECHAVGDAPPSPALYDEYCAWHAAQGLWPGEWRPVAPAGTSMELFGPARIAERRQTITVPGRNGMTVSDRIAVAHAGGAGIAPAATQYIVLRRFMELDDGTILEQEGDGINPPARQVGTPDLLKGYLYPAMGDLLRMGPPVVLGNSIRVEPGYQELLAGQPLVTLSIRTLTVPSLGQQVTDASDVGSLGRWGRTRLSPHTIYAVLEAPPQASRNNDTPAGNPRPIGDGEHFGAARVRNTTVRLELLPSPVVWTGAGSPAVDSKRRYLAPLGLSTLRMGVHTLPCDLTVDLQGEGVASPATSSPAVTRAPYVGLFRPAPTGLTALAFGTASAELFNRTLRPAGLASMALGSGTGKTPAHMPQSLYVGPPITNLIGGGLFTGYGPPWVSHRVRGIAARGADAFACGYDPAQFDLRLRVRRSGDDPPMWRVLGVAGFDAARVAAADAGLLRRYIRPDGNSEQFRKGAPAHA